MTIKSLVELIKNDSSNENNYIGNFIDKFNRADNNAKIAMVNEEPDIYNEVDKSTYTFVACMVDKLCRDNRLKAPEWCFDEKYTLKDPWFPEEIPPEAHILLMLYAPVQFRMRNMFVSENCLDRR